MFTVVTVMVVVIVMVMVVVIVRGFVKNHKKRLATTGVASRLNYTWRLSQVGSSGKRVVLDP